MESVVEAACRPDRSGARGQNSHLLHHLGLRLFDSAIAARSKSKNGSEAGRRSNCSNWILAWTADPTNGSSPSGTRRVSKAPISTKISPALGIDTLIVAGVSTSHCIYATCRDATDTFRVIVPRGSGGRALRDYARSEPARHRHRPRRRYADKRCPRLSRPEPINH